MRCRLCCEIRAQPDPTDVFPVLTPQNPSTGFAPYVVGTFSQEADSTKEERSANVPKYMPLGVRKKRTAEALGATAYELHNFFEKTTELPRRSCPESDNTTVSSCLHVRQKDSKFQEVCACIKEIARRITFDTHWI